LVGSWQDSTLDGRRDQSRQEARFLFDQVKNLST